MEEHSWGSQDLNQALVSEEEKEVEEEDGGGSGGGGGSLKFKAPVFYAVNWGILEQNVVASFSQVSTQDSISPPLFDPVQC
jgi:hypothetical protein